MILIDSQIWIYYLDENSPENHAVTTWMEGDGNGALFTEEIGLCIIIPIEIAHHLFALKRIDKDAVFEFISCLLGAKKVHTFPFLENDLMDTIIQLKKWRMEGIGGRDMMLLVTMEKNGIDTIVTHDKNLLAYTKFRRIDPVIIPLMILQSGEKYVKQ